MGAGDPQLQLGFIASTHVGADRGGSDIALRLRQDGRGDLDPLDMKGFDAHSDVTVRVPIGSHNGSPHALIQLVIGPDKELHEHRLVKCEQIYFVARGRGVVLSDPQRIPVRAGHFILVPTAVPFGLRNSAPDKPFELIGVLTGAGSLEEAGYAAGSHL